MKAIINAAYAWRIQPFISHEETRYYLLITPEAEKTAAE